MKSQDPLSPYRSVPRASVLPRPWRLLGLLLGLLSGATAGWAQTPQWQWARQLNQPGQDLVVDSAGNCTVTGFFTGTLLGPGGQTGVAQDTYLAQYDAQGTLRWSRLEGATDASTTARCIGRDRAGNLYVSGLFTWNSRIGTQPIYSLGGGDLFLAKYSPQGVPLWVQQSSGSNAVTPLDMAVDAQGNSYIVGVLGGPNTRFGNVALGGFSMNDAFVVKYNARGDVLWARLLGGPGNDAAQGVAIDAQGSVYVSGFFSWTSTLATPLTARGGTDAFLLKLDAQGNPQWAAQAGGPDLDESGQVAVDPAGVVYWAGHFRGQAQVAGTSLTSRGRMDIFLSAHSTATGAQQWVRQEGGRFDDFAHDVLWQDTRLLLTARIYSDTLQIGATRLINRSYSSQTLVAQYNLQPVAPDWAAFTTSVVGPSSGNGPAGLGTDGRGRLYVTGDYGAAVSFGPHALTTQKFLHDGFVAQLLAPAAPMRVQGDSLLCQGGQLQLTASAGPGATFAWSTGATTASISVRQPGTYQVTATYPDGRSSATRFSVRAFTPTARIQGDSLLCRGSTLPLTVLGAGISTVRWSTGATTSGISVTQPGRYQVAVDYSAGCRDTLRWQVRELTPPAAFSLGPDTTLCETEPLLLRAPSQPGVSYQWSDGSTAAGLRVQQPGTYTLTLRNACGSVTAQRRVEFRPCMLIPNVVTPNADQYNDRFAVRGLTGPGWQLMVYNRWGRCVLQTSDYRNDWGGDASAGLYYYLLTRPATGAAYKGWVEVVR